MPRWIDAETYRTTSIAPSTCLSLPWTRSGQCVDPKRAAASGAEHAAADDHAHDVARPVPDLVELRLPEPLLNRRVAQVSPSGQRLTRRPRREHGRLRGGQLGLGGLQAEGLARVGQPGGVTGEQTGLVELHLRLDQPEGHRLELVDLLPER